MTREEYWAKHVEEKGDGLNCGMCKSRFNLGWLACLKYGQKCPTCSGTRWVGGTRVNDNTVTGGEPCPDCVKDRRTGMVNRVFIGDRVLRNVASSVPSFKFGVGEQMKDSECPNIWCIRIEGCNEYARKYVPKVCQLKDRYIKAHCPSEEEYNATGEES